MPTQIKQKWFYAAQEEMQKQLLLNFGDCKCNYQLVTKDRVIESYLTPNGNLVECHIAKHGNRTSLFIYKLETFVSKHII